MELKKTKEVVENLLRTRPATRDSDELLICLVYDKLGTSWKLPFGEVMNKVNNGELPAFESVSRCRRKMQEKYPELRGKAYEQRIKKEAEYEALAKGEI